MPVLPRPRLATSPPPRSVPPFAASSTTTTTTTTTTAASSSSRAADTRQPAQHSQQQRQARELFYLQNVHGFSLAPSLQAAPLPATSSDVNTTTTPDDNSLPLPSVLELSAHGPDIIPLPIPQYLPTPGPSRENSQRYEQLPPFQETFDVVSHGLPNVEVAAGGVPPTTTTAAALITQGLPQTPLASLGTGDYLAAFALAEGDFSSHSGYPRTNQAPPSEAFTAAASSSSSSSAGNFPQPAPNRLPPHSPPSHFAGPAPTAGATHPPPGADADIVPKSEYITTSTLLSPTHSNIMPSTRKRASAGGAASGAVDLSSSPPTKRSRTSRAGTTANRRTAATKKETPSKAVRDFDVDAAEDESDRAEVDAEVIDLADTEEIPEHLRTPKEDRRIKLSAFNCVICMDDANGLTVTHCGHLFCHQCLHSSLNIDAMKNKCPICRQKIETKARQSYTPKTKGFWPLELKLMTVKRQGKQTEAGPSR